MPHLPVLLHEVTRVLAVQSGETVVDGTVNGGGHAGKLIQANAPSGLFLGVDLDRDRVKACRQKFAAAGRRVKIVHGNYADLPTILATQAIPPADALLLDLGFSTEQLESGRGFSYLKDEPLWMTYDDQELPLAALLRQLSEHELAVAIYRYSQEKYAKRIARAIKARLKMGDILTSGELVKVVREAVPGNYEQRRMHPATRTFQALRILANNELGNLTTLLARLINIMAPGGRVAIISFHSLEDRMVKQAFQSLIKQGNAVALTKKPISPTAAEQQINPASHSAKLRAIRLG